MKLPIILIFLFSNLSSALTQQTFQENTPINGKEAVKLLSKGTLVVRLSKLENRVENIRVFNGKQQAILEEKRIAEANKNLMKEFNKDYSFSDVVYAYDVDLYEYLQDSSHYVFLNDTLAVDSTIILKGPFLILASNSYKIFELYDKNYHLIEKPAFQYSCTHFRRKYQFFVTNLAQSLSSLFIRDISAEKFNKKLWRYLKKDIT